MNTNLFQKNGFNWLHNNQKLFEVSRDPKELAFKKLESINHKATIVLTKKYQNRKNIQG